MDFLSARLLIEKRMKEILSKEKIDSNFSYSFEKFNDMTKGGSFNQELKLIRINTDALRIYIKYRNSDGDISYLNTHLPNPVISNSITDKILVNQYHETVHCKDFSFPAQSISSKEDLKRIALEDLASVNRGFYKLHYSHLLFETRAFTKSIYKARDFLVETEGISIEEANSRIVDALNYNISINSPLHMLRENPDYQKNISALSLAEYTGTACKKYLDDITFHNFSEVDKKCKDLEFSAKIYSFNQMFYKDGPFTFFRLDSSTTADIEELDKLNDKVSAFGFTISFYNSLSQFEKLSLEVTILKEFFEDYKILNPNAQDLYRKIEFWSDLKILDPSSFDLDYFKSLYQLFQYKQSLKIELNNELHELNEKTISIKESYWSLSPKNREKLPDNFREFFQISDPELERLQERNKGPEPSQRGRF